MSLTVALANTRRYHDGGIRDSLVSVADLVGFLRTQERVVTGLTLADLDSARALRDAVRGVVGAVTAGDAVDETDLATINAAVRAAPTWRELRSVGGRPEAVAVPGGDAFAGLLAEIAREAVDLIDAGALRACGAPHCVLLFTRDNRRREWCGDACGNRARAARHYARNRAGAGDGRSR